MEALPQIQRVDSQLCQVLQQPVRLLVGVGHLRQGQLLLLIQGAELGRCLDVEVGAVQSLLHPVGKLRHCLVGPGKVIEEVPGTLQVAVLQSDHLRLRVLKDPLSRRLVQRGVGLHQLLPPRQFRGTEGPTGLLKPFRYSRIGDLPLIVVHCHRQLPSQSNSRRPGQHRQEARPQYHKEAHRRKGLCPFHGVPPLRS